MRYELLIYFVAEFAGEAEEVGRHVSGRGAVDASFAVRFSQCFYASCELQTLYSEDRGPSSRYLPVDSDIV